LDDELKARFTKVPEMSSKAFGCVLVVKQQAFDSVFLDDKVVLYLANRLSDTLRFKFLRYRVSIFSADITNLLAGPFLLSSPNSLIRIRI
jgi:hypothetical protein